MSMTTVSAIFFLSDFQNDDSSSQELPVLQSYILFHMSVPKVPEVSMPKTELIFLFVSEDIHF